MTSPESIARDVMRANRAPERLGDLDAQTQRRISRAGESAGISPEQLWAASRAASIASVEATLEAERIVAELDR